MGERMFVLPEAPKKLYSLYCPTPEYFGRFPANLAETYTLQREHRTPSLFVPEKYFEKFRALDSPGHRGIFHFDQRHLDFFYEHGDVWAGTQFPFYASFMLVDLDYFGERYVEKLQDAFKDYDYLLYNSGGGPHNYHFVVPHNLISNANFELCYTAFLANLRIRFDTTVWNPLCCMSLPGTIHPVTGNRKTLIKANSGKRLHFEIVSPQGMIDFGKEFFRGFT